MSGELLRQALHMPALACFVAAAVDVNYDWIEFVVDDPGLPESDVPHDVDPSLTEHRIEWDWNVGGAEGTEP